jgi:hypothetical protein
MRPPQTDPGEAPFRALRFFLLIRELRVVIGFSTHN